MQLTEFYKQAIEFSAVHGNDAVVKVLEEVMMNHFEFMASEGADLNVDYGDMAAYSEEYATYYYSDYDSSYYEDYTGAMEGEEQRRRRKKRHARA